MRDVSHTDHTLSGWVGGGPKQITWREFKRDVDKVRKQAHRKGKRYQRKGKTIYKHLHSATISLLTCMVNEDGGFVLTRLTFLLFFLNTGVFFFFF